MRNLFVFFIVFSALWAHSADIVLLSVTGGGGGVVTNTVTNSLLSKTGQTNSYATGDDGDLEVGVAWPVPRFTVLTNTNCVRDNVTGLVWARDANQFAQKNWGVCVTNCNNLNYGGQTDWRLPNVFEMESIINFGAFNPCLPADHPFQNVQNNYYYTSTTRKDQEGVYYNYVHLGSAARGNAVGAFNDWFAWPVRGPDWTSE